MFRKKKNYVNSKIFGNRKIFLDGKWAKLIETRVLCESTVFGVMLGHAASRDFTAASDLNTQHVHFALYTLSCYPLPIRAAQKPSAQIQDYGYIQITVLLLYMQTFLLWHNYKCLIFFSATSFQHESSKCKRWKDLSNPVLSPYVLENVKPGME